MLRLLTIVVATAWVAVGEAQEARMPDEAIKELTYLIGDWSVEAQIGNVKWTADYSFSWTPQRRGVVHYSTWYGPEGKSHESCLMGWDDTKKQIVDVGFISDRGSRTLRYAVQDPSHWKGTLRGLDENEKPIRGNIALEKKGPNLFIWRQTGRFVDGSPEPDYELRFTRGRRP